MDNEIKKEKSPVSKRHTRILCGIALLILAAVFAYFAVSQPSVSNPTEADSNSQSLQQTQATNTPAAENSATDNNSQPSSTPTEAPVSSSPTQAPADTATAAPTEAPTIASTEATELRTTEPVVTVQYPLNLNTCTAAELMTINGIGEARASAIIAYRDYLGGYTDVEQLKNISGIGDGIFAKIEPYVTV